jgi:hypothetical protein
MELCSIVEKFGLFECYTWYSLNKKFWEYINFRIRKIGRIKNWWKNLIKYRFNLSWIIKIIWC